MFIEAYYTRHAAALDVCEMRPIDLYDAWLFAEAEASLALGAWRAAAQTAKADAYATYRAALDREDQAARVLALRLTA